jgi:hypothetical protein
MLCLNCVIEFIKTADYSDLLSIRISIERRERELKLGIKPNELYDAKELDEVWEELYSG